jgi:hypothetical protein
LIYNVNTTPTIDNVPTDWFLYNHTRGTPIPEVSGAFLNFYTESLDLQNYSIQKIHISKNLFTSIIKKYLKYKNKYLKYKNGATHNPITKESKLDFLNYEQIKTKYLKYKLKYNLIKNKNKK